jgi:predicted enzyme related to lactoylglutathione lyase
MDITTNSLNWFEIPVTDIARAKHFYQVAFSIHMEDMNMPEWRWPVSRRNGERKVSGALVKSNIINHLLMV